MITNILEIAASLYQSILSVYFILKFNQCSWRKCKSAFPTVLLLFAITLTGDFFAPGFSTITSTVLFLITIIFALIICKKKYVQAILSACIYKVTLLLIGSLLYIALSIVINNFDTLVQGSDSIGRYIYLISGNLLVFAVLKLLLVAFQRHDLLDIKTGIITFIMSLITLAGLSVAITLTEIALENEIKNHILLLTCIFLVINIILYTLIHQIQTLQKSKYELQLLKERIKYQEERHNDATAIWNNVRKVQHDMKQHLTVISCHLEDGEIDECKLYVNELIPSIERVGKLIKSDNQVLDYLINSKLCGIKDAQIIVSGSIGNLSDIRDVDLACLLGNILDNAVEAITPLTNKKIELLFMKQNSNRIIICKNTIANSVLKNNNELKSTKIDGDTHGYGHIIINKIVQDYNGMVDYFEEDGMFGVQVILPTNDKI